MASTKAECGALSVNTESKIINTDTECDNLTADAKSTNTDTYTQFGNLSADTEITNTSTDTQFENQDSEDTDTFDTLTLARVDRENQGPWEAEYSYGGEADLHRHCDKCKKNPGHKNFIPVDKFSIEDLPEGYRDQDMLNYIRAVSDLTVRVTVKCVSDKRPEIVPWSDKQYPGYRARGTRRMTVGTGRVVDVRVFNNSVKGDTCKCKDCNNSSTPEKHFAIINILTATHVVFDELEAEHTTFHFFFDRGSSPETCQDVIPLTGGLFLCSDINGDDCSMKCFIHDMDFASKLQHRLREMYSLENHFQNIYESYGIFKPTINAGDKQPFLFIVSHPHGCSKQISLGRFISVLTYNNKFQSFHYSTPTCPGSSGAPIFMPYRFSETNLQAAPSYNVHEIHCGASADHPGINFCQGDGGFLLPQSWSVHMLHFDKGVWEDILSCTEEEELHNEYDTCQKNPGHHNFFSVDKFSMDNLPPVYRTDEIFDAIKIDSDLTVRVSVKCVSEERPQTVPGTDIPYPWYNHRGRKQLREGNGWIDNVEIYGKKANTVCKCKECQSSLSPKTEFARITIKSAAYLVFDRLEAKHTTCQLVIGSRVVTLADICLSGYFFDHDTCLLKYVCHDLDLANNINNLIKLAECYSCKLTDGKRNAKKKMTENPPLYFMVSHPHGCAKHISISFCSNHGNTEAEDSQSPITSIICPGSIGAPLIRLGWGTLYPQIL